ncbi:MAG: Dabb family protein [Acidimicrobiia bacterium]
MIRHAAIFRFNKGVTDETVAAIDAALATLPDIIPEIVSFRSGCNIGITDGAWDYGVVAEFRTQDNYKTYATNPEHVYIVQNIVGPNVTEAARIQFET